MLGISPFLCDVVLYHITVEALVTKYSLSRYQEISVIWKFCRWSLKNKINNISNSSEGTTATIIKLSSCYSINRYTDLCIKVCKLSPVKSVCKSPSGPDQSNVLCRVVGEDANVLPTNSDDQGPKTNV